MVDSLAQQDLTAIHELTACLPPGATVFRGKGFIPGRDVLSMLTTTGGRRVPIRRRNMAPNSWADDFALRQYRKRIETVYSQLEAMGMQHLHARTDAGSDLKTWASLLALAFTNILAL